MCLQYQKKNKQTEEYEAATQSHLHQRHNHAHLLVSSLNNYLLYWHKGSTELKRNKKALI